MWGISRAGKVVLAAASLGVYFLFEILSYFAPKGPPHHVPRVLFSVRTAYQVRAHHLALGHHESRACGKDLMEVVYLQGDPRKQKCGVGRVNQANKKSQDEGVFS